jgi:hypothetical protein
VGGLLDTDTSQFRAKFIEDDFDIGVGMAE